MEVCVLCRSKSTQTLKVLLDYSLIITISHSAFNRSVVLLQRHERISSSGGGGDALQGVHPLLHPPQGNARRLFPTGHLSTGGIVNGAKRKPQPQ